MSESEIKADGPAAVWLDRLAEAERMDRTYHAKCDSIDRLYADLEKLSGNRSDREFQIFWANLEVLKPTIYSRPPVPVATPRFNDRKPLARRAADVLERGLLSDFEADAVHDTLVLARDDLALLARGVVWHAFKERDGRDVPCCYHVSRKDFRTSPARKWSEVVDHGWAARRSWNTKDEVKKRFGEVPEGMSFEKQDFGGRKEGTEKAQVWELWDRPTNRVYWVSPGVQKPLEEREPWFSLTGFFPCPRPAYGTLQRETLTPVPDFVYYRDQVEEINELTARIAALSEGLRVKALMAAAPNGSAELGDAVERALRNMDPRMWVEPVPGFGNQSIRDMIMFLPVAEIATAVRECIDLRRVLIDDVYQITGLSDIMRGSTNAQETLGAQQLKSQYGSVRVRERQGEMVRLARDITRIKAEMMAEHMPIADLLTMAQVDDLPSEADIQGQAQQIAQAAEQQMVALINQPPGPDPAADQQTQQQQGMQLQQQAKQQIEQLQQTVTVEKVEQLLRDQKTRPFVLDIETDSTIEPDQIAEKQQRVEFAGALGPMLQQAVQAMQTAPQLGKFVAESLRFMASGFKADRRMDEAIDELAEQLANYEPPQQSDEGGQAARMEAEASMMKAKADAESAQAKAQAEVIRAQTEGQKAPIEAEKLTADIKLIYAKIEEMGEQLKLEREKAALETAVKQQEAAVKEEAVRADMAFKEEQYRLERENAVQKFLLEQQSANEKRELELRRLALEASAAEGLSSPKVRKTRVTKHDDRGRILEIETSDEPGGASDGGEPTVRKTKVVKYDDRGRILEFESSDERDLGLKPV